MDDDVGPAATNHVELAASELFSIPGVATAYHTSIVVNGEEFFFSDSGIFSDRTFASHQNSPNERIQLGYSIHTGTHLLRVMQSHFKPGTYDLIRKNCNSFSDCALYFLLRKRLERKYAALERLGQAANADFLRRFTKGMYKPNPMAEDFKVEGVIAAIDKLLESGDELPCDPEMPKSRPALSLGSHVTVVGLRAADEFNGQGAVIVRYNPVNGRWEARLNLNGDIKAFRAENLRPAGELVLEPGDNVKIHGLKSNQGQVLNGLEGEVLRYMHDVSRYQIQIKGGESKALKAENLVHLPKTE